MRYISAVFVESFLHHNITIHRFLLRKHIAFPPYFLSIFIGFPPVSNIILTASME